MAKNHIVLGLAITVAASTGCNVIDSSLLNNTSKDASTGGGSDGGPHDAPIDMPLDAYVPYVGNLVANPSMEQGTINWETNGGGVIAISMAEEHTGSNSLLTHMRTGAWNGPAQNLATKIRSAKQYTADVWVRLDTDVWTPGSDTLSLSTRYTCAEDGVQRFNVSTSRTPAIAPDGTVWVQPTTTFTSVDKTTCTLVEFLVYVEATDTAGHCSVTTTTTCAGSGDCPATESCYLSDYYIDDFEVLEVQ